MTPNDPTSGLRQPWEHKLAKVFKASSSKGRPPSPEARTPSWVNAPDLDISLAHSALQPLVSSWMARRDARCRPKGYSGAMNNARDGRAPCESSRSRFAGVSERYTSARAADWTDSTLGAQSSGAGVSEGEDGGGERDKQIRRSGTPPERERERERDRNIMILQLRALYSLWLYINIIIIIIILL